MNEQEYINKMYDSSLESQKQTLQQDYDNNAANLDAQQKQAQKQTDDNLNRTYVEAAKAAKNYGEVQNAYGLTSGAMAQAKLAQNNQLQSDLTTIRAQQQSADAEIERQRGLLAKEFASAIQKAQADNDLQRAQALYEQAKAEEEKLLQQQKEAASLMASGGDYSLYQNLYGLTGDQVAKLEAEANYDKQLAAAQLMAGVGDYSLLAQLYGLTPEQMDKLQGKKKTGGTKVIDNGDKKGDDPSGVGDLTVDEWNTLLSKTRQQLEHDALMESIVLANKLDAQARGISLNGA
jgi:hypothetical protein